MDGLNLVDNQINLGGTSYPVVRHKLKKWLQLEELHSNTLKAAETSNENDFLFSIFSYISVAFGVSMEVLSELDWHEISIAYENGLKTNKPLLKLPIFKGGDSVTYPWDYPGRNWYSWLYRLASKFGWTIEYLAELDIDDAVALIQEILIQEQFDKEWEWRRSQVAYGYDASTKKSKFIELPRPDWMKGTPVKRIKEPPKVRIPIHMLPVGNVITANDYNKT